MRLVLAVPLLVAGCATGTALAPWPRSIAQVPLCAAGHAQIHADFEGARADSCIVRSADRVSVLIGPERPPPINPSPWYAFRYRTGSQRPVTVELRYLGADHRYHPKISRDGRTWGTIGPDRIATGSDESGPFTAITLPPGAGIVAAQELIGVDDHREHLAALAELEGADRRVIGRSHDGRPIEVLIFGNPGSGRLIVLLGRQHPPEVTGAIAMQRFLEVLAGGGGAAARLRQDYRIIAIPLLNPDGVARGHWRTNMGGVDLNRDWGRFTQPETRAARGFLAALMAEESLRPALMIDFHSTRRNLFYLQGEDEPTRSPRLVQDWLRRAGPLLPGYEFQAVERNANPGSGTAKNHFFETYGIPAITYEVGDETDRESLLEAAHVFARTLAEELSPPLR